MSHFISVWASRKTGFMLDLYEQSKNFANNFQCNLVKKTELRDF
jgi:hypothetical protein